MMIFSVEVSFFEYLFFLPFFPSFCQGDAYLEEVSFGVDFDRDDGRTHFFHLLSKSDDF